MDNKELETKTENEEKTPKFRGLYRYVNISVKSLDRIIIVCIAVIIIVTLFALRDPGFTVTFDSRGGSDIAATKYQYGETIDISEPPTREGYKFTGWYTDSGCTRPWDLESDTIEGSFTLYAGWEKIEN